MVGLPGQTLADLACDIRFFKDFNAHMVGMGPYITEKGTPVAKMCALSRGQGVEGVMQVAKAGRVDKHMHVLAEVEVVRSECPAIHACACRGRV
jgi:hypothetical protein